MKTKILLKLIILFATQLTSGQILYSENFDNLTIGNVGTDFTATIPGKGGLYTFAYNNSLGSNNDFQIIGESGKGNIATIKESEIQSGRLIEKRDLNVFWQNRIYGNDILKFSFEIFTGEITSVNNSSNSHHIAIYSKYRLLANFWFMGNTKEITIGYYNFSHTSPFFSDSAAGFGTKVYLPADSWVTLEIYIDYTKNKIYFGIPSMNLMSEYESIYKLSLIDSTINDETLTNEGPTHIVFSNIASHYYNSTLKFKIDNINMSAINNAPTADIKDFISDKFNLYPNPAKNIINITNNENLGIELIKIYDTKGKLINTKTFSREPNVQLDISNYAVGTYLLQISTTNGTAIKK